jgi:hypothetical protein
MDEKVYKIQMRHLRNAIASLRLMNLDELTASADQIGTPAERDLIAALILALETLPDDHD